MTLTQKYQRRFYITVFSAIGFLALWAFYLFGYPFTFLHEYGHNIMGGLPFPNFVIAPDGQSGLASSPQWYGAAMCSAGSFTGLIILCGLLQLAPVGILKGLGIAAVIRAIYEAFNWQIYGYRIDFQTEGAITIAVIGGIILLPLFVISIKKGWELNTLWDRKKAAKKQWEVDQEQRRLARLNRIKTA